MHGDRSVIRQFIERVHGPEPHGWLVIWTRQDKATRAFPLREGGALEAAVDYCAERASRQDVYAAVGLQGNAPEGGGRGREDGVVSVPGVWADIDFGSEAHKAQDLPRTEAEALTIVETVGLEPSVIVRSGFGLHVYWLFDRPVRMGTDAERQWMKSLSRRFQNLLRLQARSLGWTVDPTADLCRVLRVPGTFNRKVPDAVRPVTAEYSGKTYTVDDIGERLGGMEEAGGLVVPPASVPPQGTPPSLAPAQLPAILDGCAWMRHCRDDAAKLPEPEWYRMLTVVARCEDAERWAHELSRPYSGYTERETRKKLRQASREDIAPVTCGYVANELGGGNYCAECLFRGHVNSPVTIGRIAEAEDDMEPEPPSTEAQSPEPEGPEPEGPEPETVTETRPSASAAPAPEPAANPAKPSREKNLLTMVPKHERFTDLGNAKRFVAHHAGTIAYCEPIGRWLIYDGVRWNEDEMLRIVSMAGEFISSLYPLAEQLKDQKARKAFQTHLLRSESQRSLNAMISLSRADPAVARSPEAFDLDPWLFTVNNGTIDLRTGKLRVHDPKDRITKLAPVTYDPAAQCPRWLEFLDMIMVGRKNLTSFIQRAVGASLTGVTSDKAMFILFGPGGDNGKSTMVEVIEMLLGSYARRTPVDTFLKKREGGIPNDVARLRGARFVWAAESERGARLAESMIKEMTGGDRMTARFLHREFFEFMPSFKIWLATNHKPNVRGDQAIWRRLKLIPFDYSIPKDKQKKRHEVMAMFEAELPGILNWALVGCLEWQRNGLGVPEEVVAATREYEAEQDTFAMFLEERCVRTPNTRALSTELYREYKGWAEQYWETPVSHKVFASLMSERGFHKSRTKKGLLYTGIGVRLEDHYDLPKMAQSSIRSTIFPNDEGELI
jgi:P4 family phage/plasmid primase-like protien